MLVYSRDEKSYFDLYFPNGDLERLARAEDARDEYATIVLTAEPQGRMGGAGLVWAVRVSLFAGGGGDGL